MALAPLGLACESLDPLDEHAAVPAAVKDRNFARSRQPPPEAPEEMACLVLRARRADRTHLDISQVELRGQPLDAHAHARRIPYYTPVSADRKSSVDGTRCAARFQSDVNNNNK